MSHFLVVIPLAPVTLTQILHSFEDFGVLCSSAFSTRILEENEITIKPVHNPKKTFSSEYRLGLVITCISPINFLPFKLDYLKWYCVSRIVMNSGRLAK